MLEEISRVMKPGAAIEVSDTVTVFRTYPDTCIRLR